VNATCPFEGCDGECTAVLLGDEVYAECDRGHNVTVYFTET